MKTLLTALLIGALLLGIVGCAAVTTQQTDATGTPDIAFLEETLSFQAQYIRTNGGYAGARYPTVQIIPAREALTQYYESNKNSYFLERDPSPTSDTTIGFLDACDSYDAQFFEDHALLLILLEECSGSIRHEVTAVTQTPSGKLQISVARKVPEIGTDDMAQWHIILEMQRAAMVEDPADVLLYIDGDLAWDGGTVEPPEPDSLYQSPPQGLLITPENETPMHLGGYSWFFTKDGNLTQATVADVAMEPLPSESLIPVTIDSQYAETVYLPVPGSEIWEPTNSLGYPVKFHWDVMPSRIACVCWSDTLWNAGYIPTETLPIAPDAHFYALDGGYIYELTATWEDTGEGYHGSASYYFHLITPALQEESEASHH